MAEFHLRPGVKPYPLPDPGIRHRCMMSDPMCGDWKVTAAGLTRLRLPSTEPRSWKPLTMNREPSLPRYPPQIMWSRRRCTLSSIHLHPAAPLSPSRPQTPNKAIHLWKGSTQYQRSFNLYLCSLVMVQCVLNLLNTVVSLLLLTQHFLNMCWKTKLNKIGSLPWQLQICCTYIIRLQQM